jgi:hypothetical protein
VAQEVNTPCPENTNVRGARDEKVVTKYFKPLDIEILTGESSLFPCCSLKTILIDTKFVWFRVEECLSFGL